MHQNSLVLLERGCSLPRWVDQEAGPESNVSILVEREAESVREFEARVLSFVLSAEAAPGRAILVCNSLSGPQREAFRRTVTRALRESLNSSVGRVMLVSPGTSRAWRELATRLEVELRIENGPGLASAQPETLAPIRAARRVA